MAEPFADEIAQQAAQSAKRWAMLTAGLVLLALLLLIIDNQIKRQIVAAAGQVRAVIADAGARLGQVVVTNGQAPDMGGSRDAPAEHDGDGSPDLVQPAANPTTASSPRDAQSHAPFPVRQGPPGGPRGNE